MTCLARDSCPSKLSLYALVSSCQREFLYQALALMTLAVALSVTSVRVFCTHFLKSVVPPGWSLFCHYLLACCYNFLCISSKAACFPFVELTLLNKVGLLLLIFVFVCVCLL